MGMNIVCLDMEGVLVPEIWIAFAEVSGIRELRRTTRDEPDYEKLMYWRMDILRQHGMRLRDVQAVIDRIDPLPGAKAFLDDLRTDTQVVILSDTFDQFAMPLMKKLGYPSLYCNTLIIDEDGFISGMKMRCDHSKRTTVGHQGVVQIHLGGLLFRNNSIITQYIVSTINPPHKICK